MAVTAKIPNAPRKPELLTTCLHTYQSILSLSLHSACTNQAGQTSGHTLPHSTSQPQHLEHHHTETLANSC